MKRTDEASSSLYVHRGMLLLAGSALLLMLGGCEQGMNISDDELVKRVNECHAEDNKTPGMAVACGNYFDECKRRGKKTGNYIC